MDGRRILWITSQSCTENDLLQKLLGLRSSASNNYVIAILMSQLPIEAHCRGASMPGGIWLADV